MREPSITVIMSVCNGGCFLPDAIESILNQTFRDFEFIIVDDGSTDGSSEILASVKDPRVRVLHQENRGLTASLCTALSQARGEFVARMDADDIALPVRLERQAAFLHAYPEVVLLGTHCVRIDEQGRPAGLSSPPVEDVQIKWTLLFKNCFTHSSVMFRRDAVRDCGGYRSEMRYAQDYDLWLRVAGKYRVANLKEPLLYYRMPRRGAIGYERSDEQNRQAEQLSLTALQELLKPSEASDESLRALRDFLSGRGDGIELETAEDLLLKIYRAFCSSSYTAFGSNPLQVLYEPYTCFVWAHYRCGKHAGFERSVAAMLEWGFEGPFELLSPDPLSRGKALIDAVKKHCFLKPLDSRKLGRGRCFLGKQYAHLAWHCYHASSMGLFRRYLFLSCMYSPSPGVVLLIIKSLLGRRMMEGISRLKKKIKGVNRQSRDMAGVR